MVGPSELILIRYGGKTVKDKQRVSVTELVMNESNLSDVPVRGFFIGRLLNKGGTTKLAKS